MDRIIAFKEQCDAFYNKAIVGKVFLIIFNCFKSCSYHFYSKQLLCERYSSMPLFVKSYTLPYFCEINWKIELKTMLINILVFLKMKQDLDWPEKHAIWNGHHI